MTEFQVGSWVVFIKENERQLLLTFGFEEEDMPLFIEDLMFDSLGLGSINQPGSNGQSGKETLFLKVGDIRGKKESKWIPSEFFEQIGF